MHHSITHVKHDGSCVVVNVFMYFAQGCNMYIRDTKYHCHC